MTTNKIDSGIFESDIFLDIKRQIDSGEFSLAVIPQEGDVLRLDGRGVKDLIWVYENRPKLLYRAVVADKIIGKAAAAILVLGGVQAVYGRTISSAGKSFLKDNDIMSEYGQLTEKILNFRGDDYCPVEKIALSAATASEAYRLIKEFFAASRLKSNQ